MKSTIWSVFLVAIAGTSSGVWASTPILVPAPIEKIFIPQGFDDNDKVEVIVHGHFTSSCYKMGPVQAVLDQAKKSVSITAEAYFYPDAQCTQMSVSFIKSVELKDTIEAGIYRVQVATSPQVPEAQLDVKKADRAEADDYLYAAVHTVDFEYSATGDSNIILKGNNPHLFQGCVMFVDTKTSVGPSGVIVVQPITRIASDEECRATPNFLRFEQLVPINMPFPKGEYLIHVRVLDGNAVNQLISVE